MDKKLDKLGAAMEKGFVAIAEDMAALRTELKEDMAELRTELKDDMAELRTELKSDIAGLRTELKGDIASIHIQLINIETDLKDIRSRLRAVEGGYANIVGFRKEIDHALERIARIEKHLGIKHKVSSALQGND